jgi:hypothetical protein
LCQIAASRGKLQYIVLPQEKRCSARIADIVLYNLSPASGCCKTHLSMANEKPTMFSLLSRGLRCPARGTIASKEPAANPEFVAFSMWIGASSFIVNFDGKTKGYVHGRRGTHRHLNQVARRSRSCGSLNHRRLYAAPECRLAQLLLACLSPCILSGSIDLQAWASIFIRGAGRVGRLICSGAARSSMGRSSPRREFLGC